jgi:hypothetical protein
VRLPFSVRDAAGRGQVLLRARPRAPLAQADAARSHDAVLRHSMHFQLVDAPGSLFQLCVDSRSSSADSGAQRDLFPGDADLYRFATSVFHSFAHSWACQLRYSPTLTPGCGRTNGEGNERLWQILAPLIVLLRRSSRALRFLALAIRTLWYNQGKLRQLRASACSFIAICRALMLAQPRRSRSGSSELASFTTTPTAILRARTSPGCASSGAIRRPHSCTSTRPRRRRVASTCSTL